MEESEHGIRCSYNRFKFVLISLDMDASTKKDSYSIVIVKITDLGLHVSLYLFSLLIIIFLSRSLTLLGAILDFMNPCVKFWCSCTLAQLRPALSLPHRLFKLLVLFLNGVQLLSPLFVLYQMRGSPSRIAQF